MDYSRQRLWPEPGRSEPGVFGWNPCEFFFFFSFAVLGLELRAYTLSHANSVLGILEIGSQRINCLGLASNFNPPDLCLLSS
jgi:hypothetical protein